MAVIQVRVEGNIEMSWNWRTLVARGVGTRRGGLLAAAGTTVAICLVAVSPVALSGCGGDSSGDDSGLSGTYRVTEIGTSSGTAPCPREFELGEGVTVSCGGTDIFELRRNGQFYSETRDGDEEAPEILIGTWRTRDNDQTLSARLTETRQDADGDGRFDEDEVFRFDPPVELTGAVRERSGSRLVLDLTLPSELAGQNAGFRTVLTRL
jgi:hypothetical protein